MPVKKNRGARYTPVAKRNDRPDAIAFLLRTYPQLTDTQIGKLLGTTKDTIDKVRSRSHWNSANIKPKDPVLLGLCSQGDLNAMIQQSNDRLIREGRAVPPPPAPVMPTFETGGGGLTASASSVQLEPDAFHLFLKPQFLELQPRQFAIVRTRPVIFLGDPRLQVGMASL